MWRGGEGGREGGWIVEREEGKEGRREGCREGRREGGRVVEREEGKDGG